MGDAAKLLEMGAMAIHLRHELLKAAHLLPATDEAVVQAQFESMLTDVALTTSLKTRLAKSRPALQNVSEKDFAAAVMRSIVGAVSARNQLLKPRPKVNIEAYEPYLEKYVGSAGAANVAKEVWLWMDSHSCRSKMKSLQEENERLKEKLAKLTTERARRGYDDSSEADDSTDSSEDESLESIDSDDSFSDISLSELTIKSTDPLL